MKTVKAKNLKLCNSQSRFYSHIIVCQTSLSLPSCLLELPPRERFLSASFITHSTFHVHNTKHIFLFEPDLDHSSSVRTAKPFIIYHSFVSDHNHSFLQSSLPKMKFENIIFISSFTSVSVSSFTLPLRHFGVHPEALANERQLQYRRHHHGSSTVGLYCEKDAHEEGDSEISNIFQHRNVAELAEDIYQDALDTEVGLRYDTVVYNTVLNEFAKNSGTFGKADSLLKAETLLNRLVEEGRANTVSFNSYLNCLAKIGSDSAVLAEEVWAKMEGNDEFRPDVVTYTSVIDAITRSNDRNRAERAEAIIDKMISLSSEGDVSILPNTVTYNAVLFAWSSSGRNDAASRAEKLLERMENMYESDQSSAQPNVISYTSVIDAHARSGAKESAMNAEKLFEKMERKYTEGNESAQPNTYTFNALINNWVQSRKPGSALRAEALLVKMIKLSRKGNENVTPNVVSFSTGEFKEFYLFEPIATSLQYKS